MELRDFDIAKWPLSVMISKTLNFLRKWHPNARNFWFLKFEIMIDFIRQSECLFSLTKCNKIQKCLRKNESIHQQIMSNAWFCLIKWPFVLSHNMFVFPNKMLIFFKNLSYCSMGCKRWDLYTCPQHSYLTTKAASLSAATCHEDFIYITI